MSQVSVRRVEGNNIASQTLIESVNEIEESIRNRAFEISESSGNSDGLNNWLAAERDLYSLPQMELTENEREITMLLAVPGIDTKNLEVLVSATMLLVRGTSISGGSEPATFSEFSTKTLMRRLDLSSSIDTSSVTAKLENGILSITASKATNTGKTSAAKA